MATVSKSRPSLASLPSARRPVALSQSVSQMVLIPLPSKKIGAIGKARTEANRKNEITPRQKALGVHFGQR